MNLSLPIPRTSLIWLLIAQALVTVPFLAHLPFWMIGLWLGCTAWRVQVLRMRADYPGTLLKSVLFVATIAGVFLSRGSLVGLDAGASLLLGAFILKTLEMRTRRDALVLIFLGFFCISVGYLFEDGLLWGLYSLLPVSMLLAGLIGLQHSLPITKQFDSLKLAAKLMLQAVPLMLLLFLFFPRLEPLWSLPQPSNKGITGLSDNMAPGDMADISRSAALAFRASFDGPMPAQNQLYWRTLTLDQFDGRRWSQSGKTMRIEIPDWQKRGDELSYSIVMEPSGRPWLPALDIAETTLADVRQMNDFRLQRRRPVDQPLLYSVHSWPQAVRETQLSEATQRQNLQLPARGNPQSREWAADLNRRYPRVDALVDAVFAHFSDEPYHYTLKPPILGADSIDDFLFNSRSGFCAHYAGAMTFVLRAAGVPARVVAGYQGGELNPEGHYVSVRQFDAHAWVEYWRPGIGWRSVDPTAAVAPQRVEQGLEQALATDEEFLADSPFSALRYRNLPWLNSFRMSWDNLNYGWQRWVLGYQGQQQVQVLSRWFAGFDGVVFFGGAAAVIALLALWLFKPWQRENDPQLRVFKSFERLLARHGLHRREAEAAQAFSQRAALKFPVQAELILAFSAEFEALRYAGQRRSLMPLRRHLRQLRRRLPWRFSTIKTMEER
jgi:transglutaminase-like putative cysteine protease